MIPPARSASSTWILTTPCRTTGEGIPLHTAARDDRRDGRRGPRVAADARRGARTSAAPPRSPRIRRLVPSICPSSPHVRAGARPGSEAGVARHVRLLHRPARAWDSGRRYLNFAESSIDRVHLSGRDLRAAQRAKASYDPRTCSAPTIRCRPRVAADRRRRPGSRSATGRYAPPDAGVHRRSRSGKPSQPSVLGDWSSQLEATVKRSDSRILTTHTGSLPRNDELTALLVEVNEGRLEEPFRLSASIVSSARRSTTWCAARSRRGDRHRLRR